MFPPIYFYKRRLNWSPKYKLYTTQHLYHCTNF